VWEEEMAVLLSGVFSAYFIIFLIFQGGYFVCILFVAHTHTNAKKLSSVLFYFFFFPFSAYAS
jgi:hypothetical protein